ncbi:MAG: helix-turn-helix transcriptional regulator [Firmicutes bacterium]|nr:helix-turn-helix transcriptional regulator [Bacillota bacterium]
MIYENIKEICKAKNVPISRMEEDLHFARSSVCKWNENEPGVKKVQKVAVYLGVTIEDLVKDAG